MVKLTENAYRDINIAFANEISMVCEKFDIDARTLIKLSNHHPRVNILQPDVVSVVIASQIDPWFIASQAQDITPLIQTARRVNLNKTKWVISQINYIIQRFKKKMVMNL